MRALGPVVTLSAMTDEVGFKGHRRLKAWQSVGHGLYRPVEAADDLGAWQLALPPSGRFTHLTAAAAYGWWLPPLPEVPVWVSVDRAESRPQRSGMVAIRRQQSVPPVEMGGVRLEPPAEVLLACARDLGALDLVVLLDSARGAGTVTREAVDEVAVGRRWGVPTLRAALALSEDRSESPYESLLRVLHVVCDIDVVPQHDVVDADGGFVARGDLWLRGTTVLHEYDGGGHLTVRQQRKDLARTRRIGNETWLRRGYTQRDVLSQGIAILRDADLTLGRPHDPGRIRAWHRLLQASCFTPAGRQRLVERIARRSC